MPSTDPPSPSAILKPAPAIDAPNGLTVDARTAVISVIACALAAVGAMAFLDGLDAGGAALTILTIPVGLGLFIVVIDFAWTPWQAARALRHPEGDDRTDEPPAFADTQAAWRAPESLEMAEAEITAEPQEAAPAVSLARIGNLHGACTLRPSGRALQVPAHSAGT